MGKGMFDGVFGAVPESHRTNVRDVLRHLEDVQPAQRRKMPVRSLLIAAVITALLAGTALAARYVFTALNARQALPEAAEAVMDVTYAAFDSPIMRYQPIDALLDGEKLIMTVEVQPIDPAKHLVADSWGGRNSEIAPIDLGAETWADYAKSQGKTLVKVELGTRINGKLAVGGYSEAFDGDKLLVTMDIDIPMKREDPSEPLEVELTGYDQAVFSAKRVEEEGYVTIVEDTGERNKTASLLTIEPKVLRTDVLRFEGPFEREYVTVDWVEFERSAASLGMKVQYTLHENLPEEVKDALPEVWFALDDPTGQKDDQTHAYEALDWVSYQANSDKYGDFGSPEPPPSSTLIDESVWPAIEAWPEALVLNVQYKGTGAWDDEIVLNP